VSRSESAQAQEELWDLLSGAPVLHAIAVASRLAIPDLLADGPRSAAALARATGSHEDALYRLLRALASVNVFAERPGRRFALTPSSRLLRTGVPGSMRSVAVLAGEGWRRAWYDLPHAVRTGRPAFERLYGGSLYDWLATERTASRRFDEAMRYKWETLREEVLAAFDFSSASPIVDVGGGSGMLIEAIVDRCADAEGVLIETAVIAAEARRRLRDAGLGRRCRVVAGDFLNSVPKGGDLYILAFVLHNWDDRRAARILRNCRRAMADGGRVLVLESVVPTGTRPSPAKVHDLEMLVFTAGGRERTRAEYRALLAAADLRLSRVTATRTSASLLVAAAAPGGRRRVPRTSQ
jgi:SAM-dependent methyltransferase